MTGPTGDAEVFSWAAAQHTWAYAVRWRGVDESGAFVSPFRTWISSGSANDEGSLLADTPLVLRGLSREWSLFEHRLDVAAVALSSVLVSTTLPPQSFRAQTLAWITPTHALATGQETRYFSRRAAPAVARTGPVLDFTTRAQRDAAEGDRGPHFAHSTAPLGRHPMLTPTLPARDRTTVGVLVLPEAGDGRSALYYPLTEAASEPRLVSMPHVWFTACTTPSTADAIVAQWRLAHRTGWSLHNPVELTITLELDQGHVCLRRVEGVDGAAGFAVDAHADGSLRGMRVEGGRTQALRCAMP